MGAAIGARLLDCGHDVVVWNRTAEKTGSLATAGTQVAVTPKQLVGRQQRGGNPGALGPA